MIEDVKEAEFEINFDKLSIWMKLASIGGIIFFGFLAFLVILFVYYKLLYIFGGA